MALEAFSCLLNLPESQNQDIEECKKILDFLISPLKSDKFFIPGFSSLPLSKFSKNLSLK